MGLTKNEAKVYQALLELPSIDTQDLASKTGLPRTRIYEVLAKLAAKNLVEKQSHGSGYRVIPPNESLVQVVNNLQIDFTGKLNSIRELGNYLQNVYVDNFASNIGPGVSILPFKEAESFLLDHLKEVRERVFIAVSSNSQSIDWKKSGSSLANAYHDELDVRYLVYSEMLLQRLNGAFSSFPSFRDINIDIRSNIEVHSSFIILDNVVYIFFLGKKDTTNLETLVLRTSSDALLKSFEWMYNQLWDSGNSSSN